MNDKKFKKFISWFFITLQRCIRKRFATDLGGPKLSFGASFAFPKPPMDPNLEAQSLPRTPTWTSKALPDSQIGGPKPFQNPNKDAQSAPRHQLASPKAVQGSILEAESAPTPQLGGPRRSKEVHLAAKTFLPRNKTSSY